MLNYLIRRLVFAAFTLLFITFFVYALVRHMPGTPLTNEAAAVDPSKKISKEDLARLNKTFGLDKPWYIAYFRWVTNLARGDLGVSFFEKQPVSKSIASRLGPTLLLSIPSILLAYTISIPIGLYSVARSGTLQERTISLLLYFLYSLPSYVAALWLLVFFYLRLQNTMFSLPATGMVSNDYASLSPLGKVWDVWTHMILPLTCLTYGSLAYDSRFTKANMEEVMRQDYIRTARAKGVSPLWIIVNHGFRNTLIPLVTLLGLSLPALVGGAVILESIFSWPGMGQLFYESISRRDYPLIMGLVLMFTLLTLAGQLIADIAYAFLDPRITYK
ncbi:Dipeptide transport system permease protein DppB [Anatilimnocola aggregata]|uniref:Dipeptide transport system permease protein DppB n=1 Tax=Anatilimnocola aggregata TaxID=2528021 RepID=A0A517YNN0_9BACT|nr:ABC transporter permease [Anatilimnocola aggregata]QDU31828.1 Dipeptide transport system permease protein DppB [Anatilimnocola aggregata]